VREVPVRTSASRSVAAFALLLVALGAACRTKASAGGVIVEMGIDRTLSVSELSELRIEVDPPADAGSSYYARTFAIPRDVARFPASLAIQSNGDPAASATIHLGLWNAGTPIDEREYELVNIPVDAVTRFEVTFSRQCSADAPRCATGSTCCPTAAGPAGCSTEVVNAAGPSSTCESTDRGAQDGSVAAAPPRDASLDGEDDAVSDVTPSRIDGSYDAGNDAAALAGYDGGIPCNPACTVGQTHCENGSCVSVPPSCAGGGTGADFQCGGWFGQQDCCQTLDVPGGAFYRDYDGTTNWDDQSNPATVSAFKLDTYEVTVGRFRKFVGAVVGADSGVPWVPGNHDGRHTYLSGGGLNSRGTGADAGLLYEKGWDPSWDAQLPPTKDGWDARLTVCGVDGQPSFNTWTPDVGGSELRPITCVDWYAAYAFCIWDRGFLPSATEWDYAAAGGSTQRIFAWGNAFPSANATLAVWSCYYGDPPGFPFTACAGVANVASVGYAGGQALWGQMDMTGNAYEWTFDLYATAHESPCQDCANFTAGGERILRGGGFHSVQTALYNSLRIFSPPDQPPNDAGFRCARPPG
jgi:sulfatase modifying factor 1